MVLDLLFFVCATRMKCLVLILLLFIYLQYCQNNKHFIKKTESENLVKY